MLRPSPVHNEPGDLAWTDARLTDPDAARPFYAAVFDRYQALPGAPDLLG
jgi:predicted enzyme related to lactoylglutathione lyase